MKEHTTNTVIATYIRANTCDEDIYFPCKVNLDTNEVFDIEITSDPFNKRGDLAGEFVKLPDGRCSPIVPKSMVPAGAKWFWYDDSKLVSEENISITVRDINGKRQVIEFSNHSSVVAWANEALSEDDEILLVTQDGVCIYSALGCDHTLSANDLTGFFA